MYKFYSIILQLYFIALFKFYKCLLQLKQEVIPFSVKITDSDTRQLLQFINGSNTNNLSYEIQKNVIHHL